METIKYSKVTFQSTFSVGQKLKDIVAQLEKMAEAQNKVVCRIRINGLLLSESDESRLASTDYKDIEELEVELESLNSLVISSIRSLTDFANALKKNSVESAERYREGHAQELNHHFAGIVGQVQCLAEALVALKPNLIRTLNFNEVLAARWVAAEEHMMKTVKELILAFEGQDFVLVSDVLEYELHNSIANWLVILNELS